MWICKAYRYGRENQNGTYPGTSCKESRFKIIVNLHYQLEIATTTCTLRPGQRNLRKSIIVFFKAILNSCLFLLECDLHPCISMLDGTLSQVFDPTNPWFSWKASNDPLIFGCFLPSLRWWISPSQQPARIVVRSSKNRWVFGASNSELVGCVTWDPPKNGTKKISFQEAFGRFGMSRATVGSMVLLMAEILHQFVSGVSHRFLQGFNVLTIPGGAGFQPSKGHCPAQMILFSKPMYELCSTS